MYRKAIGIGRKYTRSTSSNQQTVDAITFFVTLILIIWVLSKLFW